MRAIHRLALPALLLLVTLFGVAVPPARAHGFLLRSIPQDRAVVSRSPSRVQIWFSEGLEPKYSTLTVANQTGERVDLGDSGVSPANRAQLAARLPPNLPNGVYVATMRVAFSSDGHIQTDTLVFWVGEQSGSVVAAGASQDVYPFEVLARGLVNAGMLLVFGTLLVYRFVLYPAWSNPQYRAGGLAPRVLHTLQMLLWIGTAAALIGNAIWLVQQAATLFNAELPRVLRESLWLSILNTTQFGDVWKLRVVLTLATAALIVAANSIQMRQPVAVYGLWSVALLVSGAAFFALRLVSHAPGATLWPLASVLADWVHLLAAGMWIGGLIALVWALRAALEPLPAADRRLALVAALRRFSPLAVIAVGLMIASGAYASVLYIYTPAQSVTTAYGRTLVAKLILVAPLLLLGLVHNLALKPGRFKAAEARLGVTLRVEAALGASVLLLAALLTATPPPVPPDARAKADLQSMTTANGDLALTLTPNPGAVGSNAYDVRLTRGGVPLDGARVTVQFVYPELDKRSAPLAFDSIGDGLYAAAGAELNRAGSWQALFDITPPGAERRERIALVWSVPQVATVGAARQAGILNILAVVALCGVFVVWIAPPLRKRVRAAKWEPQSVVVGAGLSLLMVIVLIGASFVMFSTVRAFEDAATPRPRYINLTLADAESLLAGRTLPGRCNLFREAKLPPAAYLQARTDSVLFEEFDRAADSGCKAMVPAERWNLINYLRFVYPPLERA